jgi:AAA15 family ATPase/GTPase
MNMLGSIRVEGFKGIKNGLVDDIRQVNILTGKNNSGKSAFLQSIYLLNKERNKDLIPSLDDKEMYWLYRFDNPIKYEIRFNSRTYHYIYSRSREQRILHDIRDYGITNSSKDRTKKIGNYYNYFDSAINMFLDASGELYVPEEKDKLSIARIKSGIAQSPISYLEASVLLNHSSFLTSDDKLSKDLDKLQKSPHKDEFLKTLNEAYEIDLTGLSHSPYEFPGWSVYLKDGKESRSIYINMLGDGTRAALNILLKLYVKKPRIVLIDEIESHQHVKALRFTCKAVLDYIIREKAQLFVSTHSLDAIKIILDLSSENKIKPIIHHFILNEGNLVPREIPGLDAKVIVDLEGDIRFADEYA